MSQLIILVLWCYCLVQSHQVDLIKQAEISQLYATCPATNSSEIKLAVDKRKHLGANQPHIFHQVLVETRTAKMNI